MADETTYATVRHTFTMRYVDKRKLAAACGFEDDEPGGHRVDTATPQGWADEHPNELRAKLGAVWHYAPGDIFGEPRYVSDMLAQLGIELEWEFDA